MIKEYKLSPYPKRMWIAKDENFDNIKKDFSFKYEEDEQLNNETIQNDYAAIVFSVAKDNYYGYLVFCTNDCDENTLVHEAGHVVLHLYEDCNMILKENMDQEPFCYMLEYIFSLLKE